MTVLEWSRNLGPDDLTVVGLARLEAEVFRPYPEVQSTIEEALADFAPAAQGMERRHGGAQLMSEVQARLNMDYRKSNHPGLAFLSFFVIALPAAAFGISISGNRWDSYLNAAWTVAVLLVLAAVVCVIKALSTLRDRVWAGVMTHWAIGGAVVSVLAAIWTPIALRFFSRGVDAGAVPAIIGGAALVTVAYAALAVARAVGARRRRRADLAHIQPQVDAYLREFTPEYGRAMDQIQRATNTIDMNTRARLKRERDNAVNALVAKGLYTGRVPLFMNKKELGEFQLFAVAEPLLGGGPYPTR